MTTPVLFIIPGACSLGSQAMLEYLKIPYKICITTPELRQSTEFRQINPQGKVGALKDGDTLVAENLAILLYLADKYGATAGGPAASPVGSEERIKVYQWLSYLSSTLHVAFGQMLFTKVDPEIEEKFRANARKKLLDVLEYINSHLATNDYLLGNQLSFIDGQAYGLLRWAHGEMAKKASIEINNFPEIVKFLERMESVPEIKNALAIEGKQPDKLINSKFAGYFELSLST